MFKEYFFFFPTCIYISIKITLGLSKLSSPQFQNLNFVQLFLTAAETYHCHYLLPVHFSQRNTGLLAVFSFFWTQPRGVHMSSGFHAHKVRGHEEPLFLSIGSLL